MEFRKNKNKKEKAFQNIVTIYRLNFIYFSCFVFFLLFLFLYVKLLRSVVVVYLFNVLLWWYFQNRIFQNLAWE